MSVFRFLPSRPVARGIAVLGAKSRSVRRPRVATLGRHTQEELWWPARAPGRPHRCFPPHAALGGSAAAACRGTPRWRSAGTVPTAAARRALSSSSSYDDPYALLGVPRGRTDREYRVAYLKLAKTCHPDLNPNNPEATARFQRISAAYESVKTEKARADLERQREAQAYGGFGGYGHGARHDPGRAANETWEEAFRDAGAIFEAAQAWWRDEMAALDADFEEFSAAMSTRRFGDAFVIVQKRAGLILGVAIPLLVVLRRPGVALAVLRGATPIITFILGTASRFLIRNPRLLPIVAGLIQRFAAATWRNMAARARDRVKDQQEEQARRQRQQQQQQQQSRRGTSGRSSRSGSGRQR